METIRRGSRGPLVARWQEFLANQNLQNHPGAADGIFGSKTAAATREFQQRHGLVADGIAGPATWARAQALGFGSGGVGRRRECKIHPAIGIARLGNSTSEFFIGPEAPEVLPLPGGPYKDAGGAIKRQGARFRIYKYEYDSNGQLEDVREVTAAEAEIVWTVHLCNKKAAAGVFPPRTDGALRNSDVTNRSSLIIDAGAKTISGTGQSRHLSGSFLGTPVDLGDLQTDSDGHLIVLGGFGTSRSVPAGMPLTDFANNGRWHDDTSDGPVSAIVRLSGEAEPVQAEGAWVIVAPPDFGPSIANITTLYDVVLHVAMQLDSNFHISTQVSFTRDIYPILARTQHMMWVSPSARAGDGPRHNFLSSPRFDRLADNHASARSAREGIFNRLRDPSSTATGLTNMPLLNTGVDPGNPTGPKMPARLTPLQYEYMGRWSMGLFDADWPGSPPAARTLESTPEDERPAALERAALDACVGDPFYPGIEAGFVMARLDTYDRPFRVASSKSAGDLTQQMAVPWQADFIACGIRWWPGQRPNSVRRGGAWESWTPPGWTGTPVSYGEMVQNWWRLGFIVEDGNEFVEKERNI